MSKKIVLTGGGTAGHITPNIALLPELEKAGYEVFYIGSYDGMEKRLMAFLITASLPANSGGILT